MIVDMWFFLLISQTQISRWWQHLQTSIVAHFNALVHLQGTMYQYDPFILLYHLIDFGPPLGASNSNTPTTTLTTRVILGSFWCAFVYRARYVHFYLFELLILFIDHSPPFRTPANLNMIFSTTTASIALVPCLLQLFMMLFRAWYTCLDGMDCLLPHLIIAGFRRVPPMASPISLQQHCLPKQYLVRFWCLWSSTRSGV